MTQSKSDSWNPTVGDKIRWFYGRKWVVVEVLEPIDEPQQRVKGWKVRTLSGRIRQVWEYDLIEPEIACSELEIFYSVQA